MMASVRMILELLLVVLQFSWSACDGNSEVDVRLLSNSPAVSSKDFAAFQFEVLVNGQSSNHLHATNCKLDDELPSACNASAVYQLLRDGDHSFLVCTNATQGAGCASHNWTVDTVPPTAYLTASTPFAHSSNIQINISFSEPCGGNGGFRCSSPQACNLLVYGDGQVMPDTLAVLEPNLEYSLTVNLNTSIETGRVTVVMDKGFCTDSAGNMFTRTQNSSIVIPFDRRSVVVANLRTHVPEKIVLIENKTRSVLATNKMRTLRICVFFSEPVLNSSAEIMASLHTSYGSLIPVNNGTFGMRRFGYWVRNVPHYAIISVRLDSKRVITRQGAPVAPVEPVTFLYDSERPAVKLQISSKSNTIAGDEIIPVTIDFMEPVFGFDNSCISINGGEVKRFFEVNKSVYIVDVQANASAYNGPISISIPENVARDISGNPNLPETLELTHYPLPPGFEALSTLPTSAFAATALMTGFLTVSTASLHSAGAFPQGSPLLSPDPAKSVFRMAGHIQVYALSKWLADDLPVPYSQFTKGLQWSIPYLRLPWEKQHMKASSGPPMDLIRDVGVPNDLMHDVVTTIRGPKLFGVPDFKQFFEGKIEVVEDDAFTNEGRWKKFTRSIFWLGIFYGSLVLLHAILYLLIWFRKEDEETDSEPDRNRGPLFLPRFEIFLLLLGLPNLCEASTSLVKGWHSPEMVVGILLLAIVFSLLLALFLFLSIGILTRERIRYNEGPGVEREYQLFHRAQEIIKTIFGPRKKGEWTHGKENYEQYISVLGPIFEELRGPPREEQVQSQNAERREEQVQSQNAERNYQNKLLGAFRVYQAFLEAGKKVAMGIVAGAKIESKKQAPSLSPSPSPSPSASPSKASSTPTIILLCITAFQLLFMVITHPFIARRMQFVESFSAFCELGVFVACVVLLEGHVSDLAEKWIAIVMIALFFLPFIAQLLNEWYGLVGRAKELDPAPDENKSFWFGLKVASVGFLILFFPRRWIRKCVKDFDEIFPPKGKAKASTTAASGDTSSVKEDVAEDPKITSKQDPALASQGHVEE